MLNFTDPEYSRSIWRSWGCLTSGNQRDSRVQGCSRTRDVERRTGACLWKSGIYLYGYTSKGSHSHIEIFASHLNGVFSKRKELALRECKFCPLRVAPIDEGTVFQRNRFCADNVVSVHSRNFKTGAHRAPTWQKSGDITKKMWAHKLKLISLVSSLPCWPYFCW